MEKINKKLLQIIESFQNQGFRYCFSWEGQYEKLYNIKVHLFTDGKLIGAVIKKQFSIGRILFLLFVHIFFIIIALISASDSFYDISIFALMSIVGIDLIAYFVVLAPEHFYQYITSIISIIENENSLLAFETTNFYPATFRSIDKDNNVIKTSDVHKLIISHKEWISSNKNKDEFCDITEDHIKNLMHQYIIEYTKNFYWNKILLYIFKSEKIEKMMEKEFKENLSNSLWVTKSFRSRFFKDLEIQKVQTIKRKVGRVGEESN